MVVAGGRPFFWGILRYPGCSAKLETKAFSGFWRLSRVTGNPHLTRRWPFGRVTEGLPTIRELTLNSVNTSAKAQ